ncbi:MAG: hypothetical protein ABSD59_24045 [Terracidiphilus sp.]|jgi:hypothetical protein
MALAQKEMAQLSESEKAKIRQQVERLLLSHHFSGSKRYPAFLKYVVEETLDGRQDSLKERTVGIEVFGREPSFDTAADSIVRVTAAEVRKRIAQYYHEPDRQTELHIELPSGSYVPQFRYPQKSADAEANSAPPTRVEQSASQATSGRPKRRSLILSAIAAISVLAILGFEYWMHTSRLKDPLESFWGSQHPVVLCIGSPILSVNQPGADNPEIAAALGPPTENNTLIPLSDAIALGRFQALLVEHRRDYRVLLARRATLYDLRSGPAILIGALDNPWTLRVTAKLRFQFRGSESTAGEIIDTWSKVSPQWNVDFRVPYSDRTQDYAIVALTHDDTTGQPLLIAAGTGPNGTRAAGEFLTSSDDLASIKKLAPAGWHGENFEIVLATQVIQGNSGLPRVQATQFW